MDSILTSMRKGKFKIAKANYATENELYELAHYVLSSSNKSLTAYILENYHPLIHYVAKRALNSLVRIHVTGFGVHSQHSLFI